MTQTKAVPTRFLTRYRTVGTTLIALSCFLLLGGCSSVGRLDLSKADSQMRVGAQAAKQGLWREAKFRFNRAIELEPDNAQAYNNLAVACESNGEFEKARDAYLNALRINRADPYIQKNYSRFTEFYQRYEKAETKKPVEGESGDEEKKP